MSNSYQVSQCGEVGRLKVYIFCQREREKNKNCQIEADRIEESSNGREKGRFGSLKRTHFQGPGVLDSDQSNCYLKKKMFLTLHRI